MTKQDAIDRLCDLLYSVSSTQNGTGMQCICGLSKLTKDPNDPTFIDDRIIQALEDCWYSHTQPSQPPD